MHTRVVEIHTMMNPWIVQIGTGLEFCVWAEISASDGYTALYMEQDLIKHAYG